MAIEFQQILKQTQKLVMSPQMQQAIHLLQLPMMELSALIDQELASNPVLEEEPQEDSVASADEISAPETEEENLKSISDDREEISFKEEFDRLSALDESWKEHFQEAGAIQRSSVDDEKRRRFMEDSITQTETLDEHLQKQFHLLELSEEEMEIAKQITGNLDSNGYLAISLEEIKRSAHMTIEDVVDVLGLIQRLHPVGVAARDLKECLLIQLRQLGKAQSLASEIAAHHLESLAKKNLSQLAREINYPLKEVQEAVGLIGTLEPKPGRIFDQKDAVYIIPDVVVERVGDHYVVIMNDESLPHLRISSYYRNLMNSPEVNEQTQTYIKEKIQAGKWLIKNIYQRQNTVRRIVETIVEEQKDFFDQGMGYLKPMTMQKVADRLELHESTISRAIANKYVDTPQGLFQIKYFFTSSIMTNTGQDVSSTNIKEMILDIIKKEDAHHPLSDQEIADLLKEQGFQIARRTVSKYRQEAKVLPGHLRRAYS